MTLYLVKLKKPFNGESEYCFGCLAAIYDLLPASVIGTKLHKLYDAGVAKGYIFTNVKCSIEQKILTRKNTKRGKL